jgi:hypothetical protein
MLSQEEVTTAVYSGILRVCLMFALVALAVGVAFYAWWDATAYERSVSEMCDEHKHSVVEMGGLECDDY